MLLKKTLIVMASILLSAPMLAAQDAEREAVLAVAQRLMDAINTKDAELMRSVMFADAPNQSVIVQQGTAIRSVRSVDEMAQVLETANVEFDERLFEPYAIVDGGMATVISYYEFRINGELSHCGHDTFVMMKDPDGSWKVSSLAWTVRPIGQEACDELRENDGL